MKKEKVGCSGYKDVFVMWAGEGGRDDSRVKGGSEATETGERYISSGHP